MSVDLRRKVKEAVGFVLLVSGGYGLLVICATTAELLRGGTPHDLAEVASALVLTPLVVLIGARCRASWRSVLGGALIGFGIVAFLVSVASSSTPGLRARGVPAKFAISAATLLSFGAALSVWGRKRARTAAR